MPAHTKEALAQYKILSLESKIQFTKSRINNWIDHWGIENVYLSFSGGKDSTVLGHIIKSMGINIPWVFINTGLEWPEVRKFALEQEGVVVLRPSMPFNKVIEKYGYPVVSKEQAQYIREYRNAKTQAQKDLRLYGKNGNGRYIISKKWRFLLDAPFKISGDCCKVMKKNPAKKYERDGQKGVYRHHVRGEHGKAKYLN